VEIEIDGLGRQRQACVEAKESQPR
jgi:hypothetical protein